MGLSPGIPLFVWLKPCFSIFNTSQLKLTAIDVSIELENNISYPNSRCLCLIMPGERLVVRKEKLSFPLVAGAAANPDGFSGDHDRRVILSSIIPEYLINRFHREQVVFLYAHIHDSGRYTSHSDVPEQWWKHDHYHCRPRGING